MSVRRARSHLVSVEHSCVCFFGFFALVVVVYSRLMLCKVKWNGVRYVKGFSNGAGRLLKRWALRTSFLGRIMNFWTGPNSQYSARTSAACYSTDGLSSQLHLAKINFLPPPPIKILYNHIQASPFVFKNSWLLLPSGTLSEWLPKSVYPNCNSLIPNEHSHLIIASWQC